MYTHTWLVQETPELILHICLSLLQVLLLGPVEREKHAHTILHLLLAQNAFYLYTHIHRVHTQSSTHTVLLYYAPDMVILSHTCTRTNTHVHTPTHVHTHTHVRVDQLGLPPHEQVFVVDEGEPVDQQVFLLLVCRQTGRGS